MELKEILKKDIYRYYGNNKRRRYTKELKIVLAYRKANKYNSNKLLR